MQVALLIVVTVLLVAYIAFVAVGREAFTLGVQPRQANLDLEEAVDFVADRLPDEVTAQITYDDVRTILRWHIEYLRDRGVPTTRDRAAGAPAVVEDDEGIAFVLLKADQEGLEVTDEQVAAVLQQELAYFEAIGAVGREVADPLEIAAAEAAAGELPPGSEAPEGDE